jgi:hypothetical protein
MGTEEVGRLVMMVSKFHYPLIKPSDLIKNSATDVARCPKTLEPLKLILLLCVQSPLFCVDIYVSWIPL